MERTSRKEISFSNSFYHPPEPSTSNSSTATTESSELYRKDLGWLGRKITDIPFSRKWLKYIKTASLIPKMIYVVALNKISLEKHLETNRNISDLTQKEHRITLTINIGGNQTIPIALNIFQSSKSFNHCLEALHNQEKYQECFSKKTGALEIEHSPKIHTILFADFFPKLLETGLSKHHFKIKEQKIFVSEDLKEVSIVLKELDFGSSCRVYKVFDLLEKENRALREISPFYEKAQRGALIKQYERFVNEMKRGVDILRKLNENGPVPAIPPAPRYITYFKNRRDITKSFTSTALGFKDLFNVVFVGTESCFFKIGLLRQLGLIKNFLIAIAHAHRLDIVHGDIKPENILVTKNSEEEADALFLIDWDGATRNHKTEPMRNTRDYFPAALCYFPESSTNDNKKTIQHLKKCDVFGASLTILKVLLKCLRINLEKEQVGNVVALKFFDHQSEERQKGLINALKMAPLPDKSGKPNTNKLVLPQKLLNLLIEGLCSDAPTIDSFLEQYEKILDELIS